MTRTALPDICTADAPHVADCATDGLTHDYRLHPHRSPNTGTTRHLPRCVWCHALRCDGPDVPDPCIHPYHHRGDHLTAAGVTWPLGGNRPEARP